jgi:hypothetical protein
MLQYIIYPLIVYIAMHYYSYTKNNYTTITRTITILYIQNTHTHIYIYISYYIPSYLQYTIDNIYII